MLAALSFAVLGAGLPLPAERTQALRVTPLRGDPVEVTAWEIADERLRGSVAGESWSISLRNVWLLEPMVAPPPAEDAWGAFVALRKGPRLRGKLIGGTGTDLRFELALGSGTISKTYVQGLRLGPAPEGGDEGFDEALARPPSDDDLIFVVDKEGKVRRFRCRVNGMDGTDLVVELGGREARLALDRLFGVVFGQTSGVEAPVDDRPGLVNIGLHDGRTLVGQLLAGVEDAPLQVKLLEGAELRVPLLLVREIEFRSDKLLYLSGLRPVEEVVTPALLRKWPIVRDQGVGGGALRLGEKTFRKGFLLVPAVTLKFELPRRFDRLVAEVGMPQGRYGSAQLRFKSNGAQLGQPVLMEADGVGRAISLPLDGARSLTLELVSTDDLDAGARVVLGDIRVVVD